MSDAPPKTADEWLAQFKAGIFSERDMRVATMGWNASRAALKAEVLTVLRDMRDEHVDGDGDQIVESVMDKVIDRIEKL